MSYKVVLKPGAEEDTSDAYSWYEEQRKGLGEEFLSELEFFYKKLEVNPLAFGVSVGELRKLVLKRFPYVVAFEIEYKTVVVYAVLHKKRSSVIRRKRNKK